MQRKEKLRRYFFAQKGKCAYCFNQMTLELGRENTAEVEHIIPKSHMKLPGKFNEVAACHKCNQIKSDKPLFQVLAQLRGDIPQWPLFEQET